MELGNLFFGHRSLDVPVPRTNQYQGKMHELLYMLSENMGVYGVDYESELFEVHPYYWGECTCGHADEEDEVVHSESCLLLRPNFIFKPTDYRLEWYKYALRDSYANRSLSPKEFRDMINQCVAYLEEHPFEDNR